MHSNGHSRVAEAICIRPSYVWPVSSHVANSSTARCAEEGFVQTGSCDVLLTALFSGCGTDATAVAVAAASALAQSLKPSLEDPGGLDTSALEAAFNQCHQQLLNLQQQQQQQPPQQQQQPPQQSSTDTITRSSSSSSLNITHSGTSALLAVLDQQQQRLMVASSGLCRAVLARSSSTGDLTVMELTPYLALGHETTETARLDAAGSSICYLPTAAESAVHRDLKGTAAAATSSYSGNAYTGSSNACISPSEAVLIDEHGQLLPGVKASRMLGYTAAAAAGIVATPVVTSWRLNGTESFLVLGTPGLWAVMSPAEVVDYVAAAIAAGVSSAWLDSSSNKPSTAAAAAAAAADDDGIPDQRMDDTPAENPKYSSPNKSPAAAPAAAVVSLGDLLTLEAQERLKLKLMDRLFGLCPGPAAAALCGSGVVPDVSAVVLQLGDSTSNPRGSRSQVSQGSGLGVGVDQQRVLAELATVPRSCHSNAEALAQQSEWSAAAAKHDGRPACDPGSSSSIVPPGRAPAPALSSILPLLTVAGSSWPAMYWPSSDCIKVPDRAAKAAAAAAAAISSGGSSRSNLTKADVTSDGSSGKMSYEDAAAAAGLLRRSSSRSISGSGTQNSAARSSAFALSSRLSCELDLSHDHGSQGSCGCLAAECNAPAAADPAAAAAVDSPSEQSMILHKVRLAGPGELESLLFANATTSHPDTTVARVMKPWNSVISGSLPIGRSSNPLSLAGAATAGDLAGSSSNMARAYSHTALQHQHPPKRSASVLIAALNMNQKHAAAAAAAAAVDHGSGSSDGGANNLQRAAASVPGGNTLLYSYSGRPIHSYDQYSLLLQQQQQLELGSVKKARSYQALSALHAAAAAAGPAAAGTCAAFQDQRSSSSQIISAGLAPGYSTYQAPGGFKSAFATQQRAMSALPSGDCSNALRLAAAAAAAVTMPLSCPPEGLNTAELLNPEDSEGRVRGGVTRDNRSSSFRSSLDAAAAAAVETLGGSDSAAAAAAASPTAAPAAADDHEGKVRHGVPRGRSRSLILPEADQANQAPTAAAAAAAAPDQAGPRNAPAPLSAFASAAMQAVGSADADSTVSSKGSSDGSAAAAVQPVSSIFTSALYQPQTSGSGVQIRSGTNDLRSTPLSNSAPGDQALQQQQQHKPESCVRGGRARAARMRAAYSSPNLPSLSATCAAADAAYEAVSLLPFKTAADANSSSGSSPPGHNGSSRSGGHQISSVFDSTAAAGLTNACIPAFTSAFAAAATAAVPGSAFANSSSSSGGVVDRQGSNASQGCEVSDGAVHGGELGEESLEGQMHNGRRSNSLSTSLSGLLPTLSGSISPPEDSALSSTCNAASAAAAAASAANSMMRRSCISTSSIDHSSSSDRPVLDTAAADLGSSALQQCDSSGVSREGSFVSVCPSKGSVSFSNWHQQQQQQQGVDVAAPAIEVVRMPSGSFTRVRWSTSAPAAAAAEVQGLAGSSSSSSFALGGVGLSFEPATAVNPDSAAAAGGSSSHHSSSVVQGLGRRVASSAGAATAGSGFNRAAAAGSWSSSRAWGSSSSSSSRRPAIQFGKVQLPPMSSAFATAAAVSESASSNQRGSRRDNSRDSSSFQAGLSSPSADVHVHNRAGVDLGFVPLAAHASSSARRLKSQPLPTLKETPTPGSSPQIASTSSASRNLDIINVSDLVDLATQQEQEVQLQQQMVDLLQEASFADRQLADRACNSPDQQGGDHRSDLLTSQALSDHSATVLMECVDASPSPTSGGSLTDFLLEESANQPDLDGHDHRSDQHDQPVDRDQDHDQICPPPSSRAGSAPETSRHSFEFGRHIQLDALYGCSPALGNPAGPFGR